MKPIAWVCNWSDEERRMTANADGIPTYRRATVAKKAVVSGQDIAPKSGRIRHAKITRWLDR